MVYNFEKSNHSFQLGIEHCNRLRAIAARLKGSGASDTDAVLIGEEIKNMIKSEFGVTGGTLFNQINKLVALATSK